MTHSIAQSQSSDYAAFHCSGNTDILSTDEFFAAEKDGRVLTAESFTADRVLEKITAKGHARLADKEDAQ